MTCDACLCLVSGTFNNTYRREEGKTPHDKYISRPNSHIQPKGVTHHQKTERQHKTLALCMGIPLCAQFIFYHRAHSSRVPRPHATCWTGCRSSRRTQSDTASTSRKNENVGRQETQHQPTIGPPAKRRRCPPMTPCLMFIGKNRASITTISRELQQQ